MNNTDHVLQLLELLDSELTGDIEAAQTRDQHIRLSLRKARVFEIRAEIQDQLKSIEAL